MSFQKNFERAHGAAGRPKTLHGLPADGRYQGTCQACFGSYVTKASPHGRSSAASASKTGKIDLLLVLHGYERPGHGYIQGECPGRNELPFELDKTVTERFRDRLVSMLASTKSYLARLKAGEVDKLTIEIRDESVRYGVGVPRSKLYKRIEIERGWKNPDPRTYGDDFEKHLKSEIRETEARVGQITDHVEQINRRLAGWKYDPAALAEAEEREKSVKASKAAAKKATYDEKEGREEMVLAAFIENPGLIEILKQRPHSIRPSFGVDFQPTGRNEYEEFLRRIESARKRDTFGDRSFARRRIISDLRHEASEAKIKIKAPKW